MAVLSVKNLSVSFQVAYKRFHETKVDILKSMSFNLNQGEIFAIVGASGSGKSVLAHTLMGILPDNGVQSGELLYRGKPLDFTTVVKHFTLIPQTVSYLDPLMKMEKQVPLGMDVLSVKSQGLYPFQCSGGMIRNALSTVANEKEGGIIIADEPTSGLDTETAISKLNALKALTNQGKSLILITHDIDLAVDVADRIAVFNQGEILEIVTAKNFATGQVHHPYTKALFAALPQNGFHSCKGGFHYDT